MCEDRKEDTDRGNDQDQSEDRVDSADQLIDRKACGDQIVSENDGVDDPGCRIRSCTGEAEQLRSRDIAGCVNEHRADQQEQQADEDVIQNENSFVRVVLHEIRHLCAAVARADHTREIVVHRTADDVADRNRKERDGSEQDALNGSHDRACARDVQQVNQTVSPCLHRYIVYAVLLGISGRFALIRLENAFTEIAVQEASANQNNEADEKCDHELCLLSLIQTGMIGSGRISKTAPLLLLLAKCKSAVIIDKK